MVNDRVAIPNPAHQPDLNGPRNFFLRSKESTGSSRQLTIFYNGRVCIFDATEAQARAILCLAKREMEEKLGGVASPDPPSPWEHPQPNSRALSLKRSLQRFLQKRKSRIQGGSPYEQK